MEIFKQLFAPPLGSVLFALLPFVLTSLSATAFPPPFPRVIIKWGLNPYQTTTTLLTSRDQINCALQRERKQVLTV
jgi:hypothetical protein